MTSIAIIGAGLGGLVAAHILEAHGVRVTLFDKGHFPGGRLSTRRHREQDVTHDHGAQYFTVKHPRFAQLTSALHEAGVVGAWQGRIMSIEARGQFEEANTSITRHVGTPHMNAMATHLARPLTLHTHSRITHIDHHKNQFSLSSQDATHGDFDAILLNMPPVQASALLETLDVATLLEACQAHAMRPCWAIMATYDTRLPVEFDGAFVNVEDAALSWVARDSSKPGRTQVDGEAWVLHATHTWSDAHIETPREVVIEMLHEAFAHMLALEEMPTPRVLQAHRWRYAIPEDTEEDMGTAIARDLPVAVCGDWLHGGRVEGAFLSGAKSAHALIHRLGLNPVRPLQPWQQPFDEE